MISKKKVTRMVTRTTTIICYCEHFDSFSQVKNWDTHSRRRVESTNVKEDHREGASHNRREYCSTRRRRDDERRHVSELLLFFDCWEETKDEIGQAMKEKSKNSLRETNQKKES